IEPPPFLPGPGADPNSQAGYYLSVDKYFNTQKEVLASRRIGLLFAEQAKAENPYLRGVPSDTIAREITAGIKTESVPDTNLLWVTLTTTDPHKAAQWLNRYLDVFVDENARQQREKVKQSSEVLRQKLDEIKALITAQESKITDVGGGAGEIAGPDP